MMTTMVQLDQAAAQVFDVINRSIEYGDTQIRVILVNGDPWFCGRDVAGILGYENSTKAIRDNVDVDDRESLDSLLIRTGTGEARQPRNELRAIYIPESGLYSLIMSSRLETAKKFKKWVTSVALPSIRRSTEERFAIELKDRDERIRVLERRELKLKEFALNVTPLAKNEIFYIATTASYQNQHRFKYGGCRNMRDVKNRFASYNTGRAEGDLFFPIKFYYCHSFRALEAVVGSLLGQYKDKKDSTKELLFVQGDVLVELIDRLAENMESGVEFVNGQIQNIVAGTIDGEPSRFPPLHEPDNLVVTINRRGRAPRTQVLAIEHITDEQLDAIFRGVVNQAAREQVDSYDFASQKNDVPITLQWESIKPLLPRVPKLTLTRWKELIRKWRGDQKPTQLEFVFRRSSQEACEAGG